jgi:hypothetical protein
MSVRIYLSGDPVHDRVLEAFYEGCAEEKEFVRGFKYEPSDVAVIFGVFKSKIPKSYPRGMVFRQQRENKLDVVVLETGYINRGDGENHHYAAGFNGLNGRADFKNKGMPGDRWQMLGTEIQPYSNGEKIILCGQVPWDASVEMHDHVRWLKHTAANIQKITDRKIIFRPHPKAPLPALPGCELSMRPLTEDLKDAHCVVTWNSNSAVEAAILGKPVFAFDEGSMAWEIANKTLLDVDTPNYPDRKQWAHNLAYSQWTLSEIGNGEAWRHLTK